LKLTTFRFSSSDVPSGSVINGIEIQIQQKKAAGAVVATGCTKLIKGGTVSGSSVSYPLNWTTSERTDHHGDDNETWGLSLTDGDVTATNFGVAIEAVLVGFGYNTATAAIDCVKMRIRYQVECP
jgi:hypothetical protein